MGDRDGFEGLLALVDWRLPRQLCYWLATRVDCEEKELVTLDGLKFPFSKAQVHWVLGLPYGPNPLPNKNKGTHMRREEKEMWLSYGSISEGGIKSIIGEAHVEAVESPPDDENTFKRAFLMFALK